MTKYRITIIDTLYDEFVYIRESKWDNFFKALDNDLSDIREMILDDNCIEYDFERVV